MSWVRLLFFGTVKLGQNTRDNFGMANQTVQYISDDNFNSIEMLNIIIIYNQKLEDLGKGRQLKVIEKGGILGFFSTCSPTKTGNKMCDDETPLNSLLITELESWPELGSIFAFIYILVMNNCLQTTN